VAGQCPFENRSKSKAYLLCVVDLLKTGALGIVAAEKHYFWGHWIFRADVLYTCPAWATKKDGGREWRDSQSQIQAPHFESGVVYVIASAKDEIRWQMV